MLLERKTASIATLKALGAERNTILAAYLMLVGVMIIVGVLIGNIIGAALPLAITPLLQEVAPVPVAPAIYAWPLFEASTYGIIAGFAFSLWSLAGTREVNAASLFRSGIGGARRLPSPAFAAAVAALAILLASAAAWFTGAARLTAWTAVGVAGSLTLLAIAAIGIRSLMRRLARTRQIRGITALRLAAGSIGGPNSDAVPTVLSLGLGLTVLTAIGQISVNLNASIAEDPAGKSAVIFCGRHTE